MTVDSHKNYGALMTNRCCRCKVWKNEEDYTYRTKEGYYYTYCDICRDKYNSYRDDVKEKIKEDRNLNTSIIDCKCGKKIKLYGNCDYYLKRHLESKYHKNHSC